jgi:hypothetical protein
VAVEGTGTSAQYIQWASSNAFDKMQRSMAVWFSLDTATVASIPFRFSASGSSRQFLHFSPGGGVTKIAYDAVFSGGTGIWVSNSGVLVTGGIHLIVVTFDGSSASNDPVMEYDNTNVAFTETGTPSGSLSTGENEIQLLAHPSFATSIDGMLRAVLYFDHVLTRFEKDEIWNSKQAIPNCRGLVFAPDLVKAAGVQNFDGAVLGASNVLRDQISGEAGTPSGSPIARADNYLTFNNMV